MAHREGRVLLLQVFELLKIHLMNLFHAWEVEAPKVGAPSSHVTSPGPLFIGDAPHDFLLRFLSGIRDKGCGKYKKKI